MTGAGIAGSGATATGADALEETFGFHAMPSLSPERTFASEAYRLK